MHSLEAPEAGTRRALGVVLVVAALVVGAVAWWFLERAPAGPPPSDAAAARPAPGATSAEPPTTANAPERDTERPAREVTRPRPPRDTETTTAAPAPAPTPAGRELRVTTDVPGAYVFLDRKFLGSTPLTSRDVSPGSHQLNVQVEGRPPHVRTIEILADAPTVIEVSLAPAPAAAAAAFSASVAVVHQHGMGSCEGTLRASGEGLRYDTPHKDAFSVSYPALEQFSVDYQEKRLRVKQRGGRTWNFTTKTESADPLFVFHRDVEAARGR